MTKKTIRVENIEQRGITSWDKRLLISFLQLKTNFRTKQ